MPGAPPLIARRRFGALADGTPVEQFVFTNGNDVSLGVIEYGATIVSLCVPDRHGVFDDVVLGHDTLDGYLRPDSPYLGCIVGRYGNRIARGRLAIDGRLFQLAVNDGPNHLHGGRVGFDKHVWAGEPFHTPGGAGVRFTRLSPDGEEGYPGALSVSVTYTLTGANDLVVDYEATTDAPTVVNLTQHSYFNLAGVSADGGAGPLPGILEHQLQVFADRFTPVDDTLIPTGDLAPVDGTPFDFRRLVAIGERIEASDEQLRRGRGYDHNFVLRGDGRRLVLAARAVEPRSGRRLTVSTSEPGMQLYTGNVLDGAIVGKAGRALAPRSGFCLETQHHPDSPNQPSFPTVLLRPGERYQSRTVYTFGVQR